MGAVQLHLEVNPKMAAALKLYARCGYALTGRTRPLSSRRLLTVVEMSKPLT
jgi:hypothetical protein